MTVNFRVGLDRFQSLFLTDFWGWAGEAVTAFDCPKAQIGKMAPADPAFWLLREMITNESMTGRGANAACA